MPYRMIGFCSFLLCVASARTLAFPDAQVQIDLSQVRNPDAPRLVGMAVDARSSFAIANQPIGYYSPNDGSPLPIGQIWEDTFRQTAIRYPLGPINMWDWKKTIGPIASRPVQNLGTGISMKAAFGLDEYMKMAERNGVSGADQHILINIYGNINSPNQAQAAQDAADLVEYLNKPAGQGYAWADLRAQYNPDHPQPYNVGLFNLGNEPWATTEYDFTTSSNPGNNGAVQYANDMIPFITAMKSVDSEIRITAMAAGPKSPQQSLNGRLWDQQVVQLLSPYIDGISVNTYYDVEPPEIINRSIAKTEAYLDQLRSDIDAFNQVPSKQLAMMIGEHAHAIDIDFSTNPPTNLDPDVAMQWRGAVSTADFIAMTSQKNLERAHFFLYGNGAAVWHPIRLDGYDASQNQIMTILPAAQLYQQLTNLVLDESLATTTINLSGQASDDQAYSIRSAAYRSADSDQLLLMLVNRDPSLSKVVETPALTGYQLVSATMFSASGALSEQMLISQLTVMPDQTEFDLPALTVTLLTYTAIPEPNSLLALGTFAVVAFRIRR